MGVSYVGARYVPWFFINPDDNSHDWKAGIFYEPLTVVKYGASFFISMIPVESNIGNPAENSKYWINAGLYSELDVETFVNDWLDSHPEATTTVQDGSITVDKLAQDTLDYIGSAANVRAYGAVERDASVNWQNLIDELALHSNCVDFSDGHWYINEAITFPSNIRCIVGNGCTIEITSPIADDYFFNVQYQSVYPFFRMDGLTFKCNYNVNSVIYIDQSNTAHIINCNLSRFKNTGIYCNQFGAVIENCLFETDQIASQTAYDTTGIKIKSDSIINGNKFFSLSKAIKVEGEFNTITSNYIWGGRDARRTFALYSTNTSNKSTYKMQQNITGNEFDCLDCCFYNIGGNVLDNGFVYNNTDTQYSGNIYIFEIDDVILMGLTFSNNLIHYYKTTEPNHYYYQFHGIGTATYGRLQQYVSENNRFTCRAVDGGRYFNLFCGFNPISVGSSSNLTHFVSQWNSEGAYTEYLKFDKEYGSTAKWSMRNEVIKGIEYNKMYQNTNECVYAYTDTSGTLRKKDFYTSGNPVQITKIMLMQGDVWNFNMKGISETPDLDVYTRITPTTLNE